MPMYLDTSDGDQYQIATNMGWSQVGNWIESLDVNEYEDLAHLWHYGWAEPASSVLGQLQSANESSPPDDEYAAKTVAEMIETFQAISGDAAVVVSNGMGPDGKKKEERSGNLIKKTITNKQGNQQTVYVRPDDASGDKSSQTKLDPPKADSLDLSGVSDDPSVVAKLKDRASKALTRLARLAYDAALASPNIIEAAGLLIDTPDDLKKIGYNPTTAGSDSQRVADPLKDAGIPLTTYQAVNLVTTVLPAAMAWVKGKISGGKSEGDDIEQLAELLHQMLKVMAEEFGLTMPPDAETIANNLRSL